MSKETSEIAKLTERISKDPKSKLFVPLAEEYKKTGDIEMAVHVLLEGLKHNPGYVTAKSFLGRLLLEKGDYPGAQKEFEEVVKAIPDNLLAQRKLGDLYALQNKQAEALKHYKIVLAQNPGDEDFASLVSDVESGVDVSPRILHQKTKLSPEPSKMPEKKPVSPQRGQIIASSPPATPEVVTMPETTPVSSAEFQPGPEPIPSPFETGKVPAGMAAEAGPAEPEKPSESLEGVIGISSPSGQFEPEEPEEVLVVELLEEEQPVGDITPPGLDFFAETTEEHAPAAKEVQADKASSVHEPPQEEPDLLRETETTPSITADIAAVPFEATPVMPEPGPAGGQAIDQADDFTTDTLAELYIAQGFFEKAIDIYQRMLADHPNSRGLADKLERVKAMAAMAGAPAASEGTEIEPFPETTESVIPAGAPEYPPPPAGEKEEVTALEAELPAEPEELRLAIRQAGEGEAENIFAESREYSPTTETVPEDEPKAVKEELIVDEQAYDIFMPPQETARERTLQADFEPREYVPPEAGPREEKKEKVHAAPKPQAATRKETIDRLENWLKNIVKEK